MNERVYNNKIDNLRSDERKARLEIDRVLDIILSDHPIKSIIDIGTGSGVFAEAFHKRNIKTAGIDINPEMINAAKEHLPETPFYEAPAESIPLEDNSFDSAFMGLVFHEADDHLKALKEASRVAKGTVWVLEWPYKTEDSGPPLEHRVSKEFIERQARDAGFTGIETILLQKLILYKLTKLH